MRKKVKCWHCHYKFIPTIGFGPTGCPECGQINNRPSEYWITNEQIEVEIAKYKRFTREQVKQAVQNELTERFVKVGGMFPFHVEEIADSIASRLV